MNTRSKLAFGLLALGLILVLYRFFDSPQVTNAPPPQGPIVAFGDSLTKGYGVHASQSYPAHLAALIGRPVLNRGVSGETAEQARRRLQRDVLSEEPGIVIICLGGNDLLRQRNADQTFEALDAIVSEVIESGAMVVLVGIEGLPLISENFGRRFEQLTEARGCLYVPDILGGIFGRKNLMSDALHPNAEGYAKMARRVARALEPYLN